MADEQIIELVKKYLALLRQRGIPVTRGIVYGSQARGDARPESDIDVLVISPLFDRDPRARAGELWLAAEEIDWHIEPVAVGEKVFAEDDVSPILEWARQEGISVE
jgi:predicted nucleotidyltransferase